MGHVPIWESLSKKVLKEIVRRIPRIVYRFRCVQQLYLGGLELPRFRGQLVV